jgi:hypothetical protein
MFKKSDWERKCWGQRDWGQGKRVCGCGSVWGEREKAEMLKS